MGVKTMDYSKWDKLQDSDDEKEPQHSASQAVVTSDEDRELQNKLDRWLKVRLQELPDNLFKSGLPRLAEIQRKSLARFIAVSHFEADSTNLMRHRDIMDITRRDA